MFFGICFSAFNADEVIACVTGGTIDEIISSFEAEDIIFDEAFDNGQITIIEGETVQLRPITSYEIDRR